jgi:Putative transposase
LAPLRKIEWVVYTKNPFAGPEQVLRYLSRYTHRIAISNRRLVSTDDNSVAFRWKDYRIDGPERWKTMTLHPHEFIRRFLSHVLPKGFHRIRHYGLFASGNRTANIARARQLLGAAPPVVFALHPFYNATANQWLDPLSGPRHTPAYPPTGRPSQLLHPKSTIVTVPLQANSP